MAGKELKVRSSAAEFLIFEEQSHADSINVVYQDDTLWMSQKMMGLLFDVESNTITYHLGEIYKIGELEEKATTRKIRVVQKEGTREVSRAIDHYNLDAVTQQTAAEIIYDRADSEKSHMGLSTWKKAPDGKILKSDVSIAKNYLSKEELDDLSLIVNAVLDFAEARARRHIPMTMQDWSERMEKYLLSDDRDILTDAGKISMEIAKDYAESEYEKYRIVQDQLYESDFDKLVMETKR